MKASDKQDTGFQTTAVVTVAAAHFVHDTYTGFVAPLLPKLIDKLELSLTLAGSLVLLLRLPALAQPLIGHWADRTDTRIFVVLAPAITAIVMSLIGLADSYPALAALLVIVGISSASFHAPAPAMIGRVAGQRVGRGMSLFMVGGELGRAVGPLVAVTAVSLWGLAGLWRTMVLGLSATLVLGLRLRRLRYTAEQREVPRFWASLRRVGPAIAPLGGLVLARSLVVATTATYLPTMLTRRGVSLLLAGGALTIFETAGIAGALLSGTLSDVLGRRRVLGVVLGCAPLLLLGALHASGALLAVMLVLLGLCGLAIQPILLATVQDRSGGNRGTANGLYLSMSFVGQATAIMAVGALGDVIGLERALHVSALASFALLPFLRFVPAQPGGSDRGAAG